MSRNLKTKLDAQTDVSLQAIPRDSIEEYMVTAADDYNLDITLEERKKDAAKPIYLKRV